MDAAAKTRAKREKLSPTFDRRFTFSRAEILQLALDLFERNGFKHTSMKDIADVCGVTKPAIYYYFPSKYEFLKHIYDSITTIFYAQVGAIATSSEAPDERLRNLILAQVKYSISNRQFQRLFQQERRELEGSARKAIASIERKYEELVRDLIAEGQKVGCFRGTAPHLAMMIILGALSSVHRWIPYVEGSPEQIAQAVLDQIFNGISPVCSTMKFLEARSILE